MAKLWDVTLPGTCNGVDRAYYFATFTGGEDVFLYMISCYFFFFFPLSLYYTNATVLAWGTFTDLVIALYPIMIIWNLKMALRLKLIICCVLGLGVVTAMCSLVKTIEFFRLRLSTDPTCKIQLSFPFYLRRHDKRGEANLTQTDEIAPLMILGTTEMWVVLIASSVPPLWPLFRRWAGVASQHATTAKSYERFGSSPTLHPHSPRFPKSKSGTNIVTYPTNISTGSQDPILSPEGIVLTQQISVRHQNLEGGVGISRGRGGV